MGCEGKAGVELGFWWGFGGQKTSDPFFVLLLVFRWFSLQTEAGVRVTFKRWFSRMAGYFFRFHVEFVRCVLRYPFWGRYGDQIGKQTMCFVFAQNLCQWLPGAR